MPWRRGAGGRRQRGGARRGLTSATIAGGWERKSVMSVFVFQGRTISVFVNVMKRGGERITRNELAAAVARAAHFELDPHADVVVVPARAGVPRIVLELGGGVLAFQVPTLPDAADAILDAVRRFASCIPDAVVDAEGEIYEPLPWDGGGAVEIQAAPAASKTGSRTSRGRSAGGRRGKTVGAEPARGPRRDPYDQLLAAIRARGVAAGAGAARRRGSG
jgi:hypothetical protein